MVNPGKPNPRRRLEKDPNPSFVLSSDRAVSLCQTSPAMQHSSQGFVPPSDGEEPRGSFLPSRISVLPFPGLLKTRRREDRRQNPCGNRLGAGSAGWMVHGNLGLNTFPYELVFWMSVLQDLWRFTYISLYIAFLGGILGNLNFKSQPTALWRCWHSVLQRNCCSASRLPPTGGSSVSIEKEFAHGESSPTTVRITGQLTPTSTPMDTVLFHMGATSSPDWHQCQNSHSLGSFIATFISCYSSPNALISLSSLAQAAFSSDSPRSFCMCVPGRVVQTPLLLAVGQP